MKGQCTSDAHSRAQVSDAPIPCARVELRRLPSAAGAALSSIGVEGSDPPARRPGTGAGPCAFSHVRPRPLGVAPLHQSLREGGLASVGGAWGAVVMPHVVLSLASG